MGWRAVTSLGVGEGGLGAGLGVCILVGVAEGSGAN